MLKSSSRPLGFHDFLLASGCAGAPLSHSELVSIPALLTVLRVSYSCNFQPHMGDQNTHAFILSESCRRVPKFDTWSQADSGN